MLYQAVFCSIMFSLVFFFSCLIVTLCLLQSAPQQILESHQLASVTLEYRRECGRDSVLQSLTAVSDKDIGNLVNLGCVECQHLLRLEEGAEVLRARTEWRPKDAHNFGNVGPIPAEST